LFGSSDEDEDFDPVPKEDVSNIASTDVGKKLKRSLMDIELFGDESDEDDADAEKATVQENAAEPSEVLKPKKKRLRRQAEGEETNGNEEEGLDDLENEVGGDQEAMPHGEEGVAAVDIALSNSKRSRVVTDSDDEEGS
jgi:hypothetical protein